MDYSLLQYMTDQQVSKAKICLYVFLLNEFHMCGWLFSYVILKYIKTLTCSSIYTTADGSMCCRCPPCGNPSIYLVLGIALQVH